MKSSFATRLRFLFGKTAFSVLDYALSRHIFPFGSRFPVGIRFRHDLVRFLGRAPSVVIDVGANVGQSAIAYAKAWPRCSVFSFEPVTASYQELTRRCGGYPQITCFRRALGSEERQLQIRLNENSELNSLLDNAPAVASLSAAFEEVNVQRLDQFAAEQALEQIDLLKIDAEGFELRVLQGARGLLSQRKIAAIYAECSFLRSDAHKVLFQDLDHFLTDQGFLFSGFYEMYRWGPAKRWSAFANGCWIRNDA